jgi:Tol biopolymer transport system component
MPRHVLAVLVLLTLAIRLPAQTTTPADVLFKTALQLEQVDGNLAGAMKAYQSIVDQHPQHPVAARALVQMAGIHEQQGDAAAALELYRSVLSRHADSPAAAVARAKVAAAGSPAAQLSRREIPDIPRLLAEFGQVSPDGRWLSFNDTGLGDASGNLGIWRIGTRETRLVTNEKCCDWTAGYSVTSIWSRDSRRLAYLWLRLGAQKAAFELRIVAREGGASRTLFAETPDTRTRLGLGLALDRQLGDRLWLSPFDWSPDGSWILVGLGEWAGPGVVARTRLARVALADGAVTTVAQLGERGAPDSAQISPDGAFVVYDYLSADGKSDTDVFIVSAAGGAPRALVTDPSSVDAVVGWMPDSRHLLYTSNGLGTIDLRALPMRAGQQAGSSFLLQSNVGQFTGRGLTADGRFHAEHAQPKSDVFVADIDAATGRFVEAPRPLPRAQTGTRHQASWSPDGTRIAYFHRSPLDALTLAGAGYSDTCRAVVSAADSQRGTARVAPGRPRRRVQCRRRQGSAGVVPPGAGQRRRRTNRAGRADRVFA